jgi:hypothetical protein
MNQQRPGDEDVKCTGRCAESTTGRWMSCCSGLFSSMHADFRHTYQNLGVANEREANLTWRGARW